MAATQIGDTVLPPQPSQVTSVINSIKDHTGERLPFRVQRNGEMVDIMAVPERADDGKGKIGVLLAANTTIKHTMPNGLLDAAKVANSEFVRLGSTVTNGLGQIVTNFNKVSDQIAGPVAIVAQVGSFQVICLCFVIVYACSGV